MAKFQVEDQVKIKNTLLGGVVKGAALDQTTLEIQYLVEYVDNDGEEQSRYFDNAVLEAV